MAKVYTPANIDALVAIIMTNTRDFYTRVDTANTRIREVLGLDTPPAEPETPTYSETQLRVKEFLKKNPSNLGCHQDQALAILSAVTGESLDKKSLDMTPTPAVVPNGYDRVPYLFTEYGIDTCPSDDDDLYEGLTILNEVFEGYEIPSLTAVRYKVGNDPNERVEIIINGFSITDGFQNCETTRVINASDTDSITLDETESTSLLPVTEDMIRLILNNHIDVLHRVIPNLF